MCTQVADFRKTSGAQARCGLCFSSAARPRQLTIAIGHTAYLALPAGCAPRCMCAGRLMSARWVPPRSAAASSACTLSLGVGGVAAPMVPGCKLRMASC